MIKFCFYFSTMMPCHRYYILTGHLTNEPKKYRTPKDMQFQLYMYDMFVVEDMSRLSRVLIS